MNVSVNGFVCYPCDSLVTYDSWDSLPVYNEYINYVIIQKNFRDVNIIKVILLYIDRHMILVSMSESQFASGNIQT